MKKDNHPISLRVSEEILSAISEHREDTPLTHWLRDAINLKLQTEKGSMSPSSETTTGLQERLSSVEARLSELEVKQSPPKGKDTQTIEHVTSPELKPINGVVSHKIYRNEIDSFVIELVKIGQTLQAICDHLNNLGWLTTRGEPWTRNAVGAIPRRLKGKG
jgi:hypothetical protein